jgi:hypothetical protein
MKIQIVVFRAVNLYSDAGYHLQGEVKAARSFEVLVSYITTRCHIPEDHDKNSKVSVGDCDGDH